jgi:MFS family permease
MTQTSAQPRQAGKSTLAILAGLVSIFVLSLGTDQILHMLDIYPPWSEPMYDPGLNLLALGYRLVFNVFGCWLTARLAPRHPMRHAMILGGIGFVLSTIGAIGAIAAGDLGPNWYPILLALSALPCAWLGGRLAGKR